MVYIQVCIPKRKTPLEQRGDKRYMAHTQGCRAVNPLRHKTTAASPTVYAFVPRS